ncbi:Stp1/IreP family PP2C-type Ser/Thr phosphatase [Tepidimonas taiwanensis]|uniref:Serine/threonine phosphatase stp n=1 Tax=Tepidimonas taiwanensis TaxID=307486 RepID=A0A554WZS1_9BURK|nr:Stp1/IreP family PP2C-type Ser/Thr phosphatase [Tepidimonas taiwanensis]MCX7692759.1 Stp1/IreP family PP2C-type Ser/Thr phosphatase [Tepidimonas taiwanensis]MDM7463106.1 Stp1/IreP family PP2C-type Ser/Thr phosphatase [Tepidimonas taiwanensis]TSE29048.1 Serine/threonine phosphatase stp [Tepidimonas taiwanensis]UBQ05689.1 Stp1/IreP family PP2C-type Ser/Thr phosphatase [Tepidimonas taiwanensis]
MLSYRFACATDPGRVRPNNEDTVRIEPDIGLVVVADGLGGYNAGEVASRLCCDTVAEIVRTASTPRAADERLRSAIEAANQRIHAHAQRHAAYHGMATTVVAVLVSGEQLTVAHVGDSRLYRLRHGRLVALTRDHTLVQEYIDAGWLHPDDIHHVDYRNIVTRAVGALPAVTVDVAKHTVQAGDTYLLCSDGLTEMLSDAEIEAILCNAPLGPATALALIDAANAAGGSDNIAVAMIYCTNTGGSPHAHADHHARWT